MIQAHNLVKSFGPCAALDGVSFVVEAGESVTLVGPNGAGKTTLLRILATLSRPTSGSVRIAGLDPRRAGMEVRRRIGFLSHRTLLYEDMTAEQNLRFYATIYDLGNASRCVEELLERMGLWTRRHDLAATPFDRLCKTAAILPEHRAQLDALRDSINPRRLREAIYAAIEHVLRLPCATPGVSEDDHQTLACHCNKGGDALPDLAFNRTQIRD